MTCRDDRRVMTGLREASNLSILEARLKQAAPVWGFSEYCYTYVPCGTATALQFGENRGNAGVLSGSLTPLFDFCRKRIAPVVWRAERSRRYIQIVENLPVTAEDGLCGVSIPIHSPDGGFAILTVTSACATESACASACVAKVHAVAMVVHENAMRNCESTRNGVQYETLDVSLSPLSGERKQNKVEVSTVH